MKRRLGDELTYDGYGSILWPSLASWEKIIKAVSLAGATNYVSMADSLYAEFEHSSVALNAVCNPRLRMSRRLFVFDGRFGLANKSMDIQGNTTEFAQLIHIEKSDTFVLNYIEDIAEMIAQSFEL